MVDELVGSPCLNLPLVLLVVAHGDSSFSTCQSRAGLFAIAARFNHKCHPSQNVHYEFDEQLGCLVLTVSADKVNAGEELTISYGSGRTPKILHLWYGFRCQCGSCKGLSDEEFATIHGSW